MEPIVFSTLADTANDTVRTKSFELLKNGLVHQDQVFRLAIYTQCFNLIEQLTYRQHPDCGNVYKLVVQTFLERLASNQRDLTT